jgi:hypothetical protein
MTTPLAAGWPMAVPPGLSEQGKGALVELHHPASFCFWVLNQPTIGGAVAGAETFCQQTA